MSNPTAAMIVIGDEILSGRTRDANMYHLAGVLAGVGIDLKEVRVISDDPSLISTTVNAMRGTYDHIFTSGGIGPTHDDITADNVAAAFGVHIDIRDDARAILEKHYKAAGIELNAARLRMARIPEGATLIDNPVSKAPGFTLGNVHVMAGVPKIFEAMLQSILPTLTGGAPIVSDSVQVNRPEGEIAGPLAEIAAAHPDVSIGSYPFSTSAGLGAHIVARALSGDDVAVVVRKIKTAFGLTDG